eukprot:2691915-Pleurochrysis_carterae.AAC.1
MPPASTASVAPTTADGRETRDAHNRPARPAPFQRSLGDYPLRSRGPSALLALRARSSKPRWGRGT